MVYKLAQVYLKAAFNNKSIGGGDPCCSKRRVIFYNPHEPFKMDIKLQESYIRLPCSGGLTVWPIWISINPVQTIFWSAVS